MNECHVDADDFTSESNTAKETQNVETKLFDDISMLVDSDEWCFIFLPAIVTSKFDENKHKGRVEESRSERVHVRCAT